MKEKIKNLDEIAEILSLKKSQGKRIVLCHGVFDLLHIGHIKHLQEAKNMGVSVTIIPLS